MTDRRDDGMYVGLNIDGLNGFGKPLRVGRRRRCYWRLCAAQV